MGQLALLKPVQNADLRGHFDEFYGQSAASRIGIYDEAARCETRHIQLRR
jgi:hypothetical protein